MHSVSSVENGPLRSTVDFTRSLVGNAAQKISRNRRGRPISASRLDVTTANSAKKSTSHLRLWIEISKAILTKSSSSVRSLLNELLCFTFFTETSKNHRLNFKTDVKKAMPMDILTSCAVVVKFPMRFKWNYGEPRTCLNKPLQQKNNRRVRFFSGNRMRKDVRRFAYRSKMCFSSLEMRRRSRLFRRPLYCKSSKRDVMCSIATVRASLSKCKTKHITNHFRLTIGNSSCSNVLLKEFRNLCSIVSYNYVNLQRFWIL